MGKYAFICNSASASRTQEVAVPAKWLTQRSPCLSHSQQETSDAMSCKTLPEMISGTTVDSQCDSSSARCLETVAQEFTSQSIVEGNPAKSAAVTKETQPAHCSATVLNAARVEMDNEQFTVERQPSVSCVDPDRQAAGPAQQFEQSEQLALET